MSTNRASEGHVMLHTTSADNDNSAPPLGRREKHMLRTEDFKGVIVLMKFGVSSFFSMQIMGALQKSGGPLF